MELYRTGLSDAKIAAELGVSKDGVTKWRRRNGLTATNTNRKEGAEQMASKKTIQTEGAGKKNPEVKGEAPWGDTEQVPAQKLREWAREMRGEKEKLQADLERATARGDELEAQNRQLRQKPAEGSEAVCENAGPEMALPVLTELLGKIAQGWPTAKLSGNPGACRALALHGADLQERADGRDLKILGGG